MSHTYTAIVLENTGFNAVNIPVSKTVARASAKNEHICTGLTLTQQKWLSSIRVPLEWASVNEADYMLIYAETEGTTVASAFCYFVTGVTMQAEDVAELSIVPDFLTSVGVNNLTLIDGLTIRSTYALDNVAPQNLANDDVYITPSEPMELKSEWIADSQNGYIYLDSLFDIVATAQSTEGVTYTDSTTNDTVTVPQPIYADPDHDTSFNLLDGTEQSRTFTNIGVNAVIYNPDASAVSLKTPSEINELIRTGMARLRSLGLENGLLHQVFLPAYYVNAPVINERTEGATGIYHYHVATLTSSWHENQTSVAMIQDTDGTREAGVINFSQYAKFGLMAVSGDAIEVEPKDLMTTGNPYIISVADPRPEGNPFFRFKYIHNTDTNRRDFFRNAIKGLPWKNVPLVFTEASQNALTTARYNTSRNIANVGMSNAFKSGALGQSQLLESQNLANKQALHSMELNTLINTMGVVGSLGEMGVDVGLTGVGVQMGDISESVRYLQQGANDILNYVQLGNRQALLAKQNEESTKLGFSNMADAYSAQKISDLLEYGLSINYQTPTVIFPYNTETLRDFYGNGVYVYRFWYSSHDASRIKRILRAYGAKYSMRTESAHLQIPSGKDYIYIETQGATVGELPKWQADGVALQLNNGVRIWNTRPHHIA